MIAFFTLFGHYILSLISYFLVKHFSPKEEKLVNEKPGLFT